MKYNCSICGKEFDTIEELIKDLEAHKVKENVDKTKELQRKKDFKEINMLLDKITIMIDNFNLKYEKDGYKIGYTLEITNPKKAIASKANDVKANESDLESFLRESLKTSLGDKKEILNQYTDKIKKNINMNKSNSEKKEEFDILNSIATLLEDIFK